MNPSDPRSTLDNAKQTANMAFFYFALRQSIGFLPMLEAHTHFALKVLFSFVDGLCPSIIRNTSR